MNTPRVPLIRVPLIVVSDDGTPWLHEGVAPEHTFEEPDIENKEFSFWDVEGRAVDARYVGEWLEFSFVGGEPAGEAAALEIQLLAFARRIGWAEDGERLLALHAPYPIVVRYLVWASKQRHARSAFAWQLALLAVIGVGAAVALLFMTLRK